MVGQKSMCNLGQRGILMDIFILTTFDKVVIQLIKKKKIYTENNQTWNVELKLCIMLIADKCYWKIQTIEYICENVHIVCRFYSALWHRIEQCFNVKG